MGTWAEVLTNVSKYRANEPDPLPDMPSLWDPNIVKLMQIVDDVYDNAGFDTSNGGLYYMFTEKGCNDWFQDFVVKNKEYSVVSVQNSLKVWGEITVIGRSYNPRIAGNRQGW
jgi:hypothetical protein